MNNISKYALLGVKTEKEINIGDYIQALASRQFLPKVDSVIQREELKDYSGENVNMIMNGWYMHNPEQWPPSNKINPLFVAFHQNVLAEKKMMNEEGVEYLKKWAPIGCRDKRTRDLLLANGIDSYFSGCMTLTLGKKYSSEEKDGKIYFVDPAYTLPKKQIIEVLGYWLTHFKIVKQVANKRERSTKRNLKSILRDYLYSAQFLRVYSKIFNIETILSSTFVCQQSEEIARKYKSDEELLNYAEKLVSDYAKADFVVTSRIHCALPCLGLGTSVLFTIPVDDSEASTCRFDGLTELFTCIKWNGNKLIPDFKSVIPISSSKDFPRNKDKWRSLAHKLSETCTNWVNHNGIK